MILVALLVLLAAGGLVAWVLGLARPVAARWISLLSLGGGLVLVLAAGTGVETSADWIPRFGIRLSLAMDGLSRVLVLLTLVLGLASVLASWTEIHERVGFFHFNLLWVLTGVAGVFLARDLFLFSFAWELMLVPMTFLIGIWGHANRVRAAIKFFLFTQAGGLAMFVALLVLVGLHHGQTGRWTFAYEDLLATAVGPGTRTWLFLGFLFAFAVKLPVVPLHPWLPDAHTEAPTAGSVVLAGLLLKTGGYGILRFAIPLFPEAAEDFVPFAVWLGVAGILYGGLLAFAQTDLKRLVAYSSISHLGFVLVGAFAGTKLARDGAVLQMVAHGLSTGALFILVGIVYQRTGTRDLVRLGGLWARAPRLGAAATFFVMASLGLPGLASFVAEFLVLFGTWPDHPWAAAFAAAGLVLATAYSLAILQRAFHGPPVEAGLLLDLTPREVLVLGALAAGLVWLGLAPQPLLAML